MKEPLSARERRGLLATFTAALLVIGGAAWMKYYPHSPNHTEKTEKGSLTIDKNDAQSDSEESRISNLKDSISDKEVRRLKRTGTKKKTKKKAASTSKSDSRDPFEPIPGID